MPDKIIRTTIELIDGEPCVVFSAKGKNLYFPAKGLQAVFDDAMIRFHAFEAQQGIKAGEWSYAKMWEPQTWTTATTDAGKAAVIVDRGLPTEQTFVLSWDFAAELGQQLVDAAAVAPRPTKPQ